MNETDGKNQPQPENLPPSAISGRVEQLRRRIDSVPALAFNRRRSDYSGFQTGTPGSSPQAGSGPSGLVEYWGMLRRRKWLLALMMILGAAGGLLFTLPQTPVYQATTTIEVLDMNSGVVGLKDGNASPGLVEETNLQTQVDILGSATLQSRVIHKLVASEKTIEQPVDRMERWRHLLNLPARPVMSREDILGSTAAGISVSASSASRIIRIDCDSSNPKVAADYANTLAEEFINRATGIALAGHPANQRIPDAATRGTQGQTCGFGG